MTGEVVLPARQGNTFRLRATFPAGVDLAGRQIVFFARAAPGRLIKRVMAVNAQARTATVEFSPAETRQWPVGTVTSFEIEDRFNGDQVTVRHGVINVAQGINDDA